MFIANDLTDFMQFCEREGQSQIAAAADCKTIKAARYHDGQAAAWLWLRDAIKSGTVSIKPQVDMFHRGIFAIQKISPNRWVVTHTKQNGEANLAHYTKEPQHGERMVPTYETERITKPTTYGLATELCLRLQETLGIPSHLHQYANDATVRITNQQSAAC